MPRISVIIPTYNRAHLICDAVDSVLNQTYKDFEIIVVDDDSTDNTKDILNKYGSGIIYIHQKHKGSSEARNTALNVAKGKYIAFLDSDDVWLPQKLEKQVPLLDSRPDAGVIHTLTEMIDLQGKVLKEESRVRMNYHQNALRRGYTYETMSYQCIMWPSTILVRKSCFDEFGGFDPRVESFEDWDLYLRIALKYQFICIPEILVQFRHHENHRTKQEFTQGRINHCLKHLSILKNRFDLAFREKALRNLYLNLATAFYMIPDMNMYRKYLKEAVKSDFSIIFNPQIIKQYLLSILPQKWVYRIRNITPETIQCPKIYWELLQESNPGLYENRPAKTAI